MIIMSRWFYDLIFQNVFENIFFWDTTVNSSLSLYVLNIIVLFYLAHENGLQ